MIKRTQGRQREQNKAGGREDRESNEGERQIEERDIGQLRNRRADRMGATGE